MKNFKVILFILIYLAIYFILQFFYIIVALVGTIISSTVRNQGAFDILNFDIEGFIYGQSLYAIIFAAIVSFVIYLAICKGRHTEIFKVCNFRKIGRNKVLYFIPLGIGLNFLNNFIVNMVKETGVMEEAFSKHEESIGQLISGNYIVVIIAVGIVAPIIEEIIFRGLIQSELKKVVPQITAVIIQAALFGLYHMQLIQGIYAFGLGIVLGLMTLWFRSIWAGISLHVVFNLTSAILSRLEGKEISDTVALSVLVLSIIAGVISFVYLYKNRVDNIIPNSEL